MVQGLQFLSVSSYPTREYKDHWATIIEEPSMPISIYRISTQGRVPFIQTELVAQIRHSCGLVRSIKWAPYRVNGDCLVVLALFSDGRVRLWRFDVDDIRMSFLLDESVVEIAIDDIIITTIEWCQSVPGRLAVGTSDGHLLIYQLQADGTLECIAGLRPLQKPITMISFHHEDPMIVGLGVHDSPAIQLSLHDPYHPSILQSSLSLVPIVRWSAANDMWIMGDSENSVRALPLQSLKERSTIPIATFTASLLDCQTSPCHNVIALCPSNGAVHITPVNMPKLQVYEQCILKLHSMYDRLVEFDDKAEEAKPHKGPITLPKDLQGIGNVVWSRSKESPGLLIVGLAAIGLVVMFPIDGLL